MGSIAGVATAIAAGGLGAIRRMAITGLLSSTLAYAEAMLAQLYRCHLRGGGSGGMSYYIKCGLRAPWLAAIARARAAFRELTSGSKWIRPR